MVTLVVLLLQASLDVCGTDALALLTRAAERRDHVGAAEAASVLTAGARAFPDCVPLTIGTWTMSGWLEARAAAPKGGASEALRPARAAVEALEGLISRSVWRVQNDYARAAIDAAMAAAQDERSDMSLYLTHARGLSDRLALADDRAEWPLPIDELDGELWLEVDRYAESRQAYARAVDRRATPSALVGLARANDRLKDERAACAAYRRALEHAEGLLASEARAYVDRPGCR